VALAFREWWEWNGKNLSGANTTMTRIDDHLFRPALLAALAFFLVAVPVLGQVPGDAFFSGFKPNGEFLFELGGGILDNAEIYFSEKAGAFLIMAPELASPLLLGTRTGQVESVHLMKVAKRSNGTIDLLADATFEQTGRFKVEGAEVHFEVKGQTAKLVRKPDLIGLHKAEGLKKYKVDYAYLADQYSPKSADLAALRVQGKEVRVLIYFGSWCSTCSRLVPRVLKVAEELKGSKIQFEYYGLPRQMDTDPRTKRDKITGVPTGIVYVDNREVGRLAVKELNAPEIGLKSVLEGS
jgi:thiol-disulfide isomerase/thioredoxin